MASVTFENVTKRFDGDVVAVDGLDLAIDDGEFMVLLGPSGCGKTTALRMIAGLEDITDGQAVDRRPRGERRRPGEARRVDGVPELRPLPAHVRAPEHRVAAARPPLPRRRARPARPASSARAERDERVDEAARVLGLDELLGRKPAALSGGQRQRVALARAFVGRPQAFLMDEPLSNLDAKLRAATRLELVDLHRRVQTTVIYVTHDQVEAMTMADRIAIMSAGRLQQVGTPQEVYDAPANLFVAQFIGTPPMNTMPGTVSTAGGTPAVDVGGGHVPVPPGLATSLDDGRPGRGRHPPRAPGAGSRRARRAEGARRRVAGPRVPGVRHDRRGARRRAPGRHGRDRRRRLDPPHGRPRATSTCSTPTRRTA